MKMLVCDIDFIGFILHMNKISTAKFPIYVLHNHLWWMPFFDTIKNFTEFVFGYHKLLIQYLPGACFTVISYCLAKSPAQLTFTKVAKDLTFHFIEYFVPSKTVKPLIIHGLIQYSTIILFNRNGNTPYWVNAFSLFDFVMFILGVVHVLIQRNHMVTRLEGFTILVNDTTFYSMCVLHKYVVSRKY